jgi:hypothetical protein
MKCALAPPLEPPLGSVHDFGFPKSSVIGMGKLRLATIEVVAALLRNRHLSYGLLGSRFSLRLPQCGQPTARSKENRFFRWTGFFDFLRLPKKTSRNIRSSRFT